jgi:hypothetical protein
MSGQKNPPDEAGRCHYRAEVKKLNRPRAWELAVIAKDVAVETIERQCVRAWHVDGMHHIELPNGQQRVIKETK